MSNSEQEDVVEVSPARAEDAWRPFRTIEVGGVPFAITNLAEATAWFLDEALSGRAGVSVRLANAHGVSVAAVDPDYRAVLRDAGVNLPDGLSVTRAMALLGARNARQVRGPSFFERALLHHGERPVRHFFVGATDATLERLVARFRREAPTLHVAGTYSPPFAPLSEDFLWDILAHVPKDCDVIWVGLGTPKQDVVAQWLSAKSGRMSAAVGAAFDLAAGTAKAAPVWMQRAGLEWFYRLVLEPRRLWRRYLVTDRTFVFLVARQLLDRLR